MCEKKLAAERAGLKWGLEISCLPIMTWDEFQAEADPKSRGGQSKKLIAIAGVVHNVSDFVARHPGGDMH
jgi:stearoyl-CoA desaturase (delta-9 desaturase)